MIAAFFAGRLRQRLYDDAALLGDSPDAARQVAAGYMCLACAVGWAISILAVLAANPVMIEAHVLGAANFAGSLLGFAQLRRRRDPRRVMHWLVLTYLATVAILSFRHSGIVAPIVGSLPVLVGVAALFQSGRARLLTLALGAAVLMFCLLTASGLIGIPTTLVAPWRAVLTVSTMACATVALGGLAWMANITRDYALDWVRRANEAVTESMARTRLALEAARVALWDVPDAAERRFHVSESFQTVTGYTAEELNAIFVDVGRFIHPEDVDRLNAAFRKSRSQMTRLRVDVRLKTRTRGYRWFSIRARYLRNESGGLRISGSLQDINFIKTAEEALRQGRDQARQANKAKSDFIAVMSHEVRTPLNAILGSVDVLKRVRHDPRTAELIDLIDDAGRGLLTIVNDLLDVSRIDAGKLEISNGPTDLGELVRRTVDMWRSQAGDKGLRLEADCSGADGALLMVDGGRIRQILGNLLSNAVKYTDLGSVTAKVETRDLGEGRVEITLSVTDTGPGVPDAVAESIFAAFQQGPDNASRGGAGLGLFISRRLARLMGGDLTVETGRRGGACFRLVLAADRMDRGDAHAADGATEPAWAGRRILCVDDNANNRRIVELLLSRFGIEVTSCASGAEAIDICAIETFDLILMDIVMPEMDGMETLRRLRADPDGLNRATPAIALTARLNSEDLAAYDAAGFGGAAGKPINVRELAAAMAGFLNAGARPTE